MNDGRTDRSGRFIFGGMIENGPDLPGASVWCLEPNLALRQLFGGVGIANGICFSPDGATMWFADSNKGLIERFDYDAASGQPTNRRTLARSGGVPDGSCVDGEGYVWSAVWEGYRLERYAPDGKLDGSIDVPVRKPTCCAFGGTDLSLLFITSSRVGESGLDLAGRPESGGLFVVDPGVRGVADTAFAG